MAPPPSISIVSPPRRLSTSFVSDVISTSASPLRSSFSLTCRSPYSPTFPSHHTEARGSIDTSGGKSRTHLKVLPPCSLDIKTSDPKDRPTSQSRELSNGEQSPLSPDSATDETWFLQQPLTPGVTRGRTRGDESKLGVLSAINIIIGKTVGVGAYLVPSAIFAEVGSVGMALSIWAIGSLISFCGLAVYLVGLVLYQLIALRHTMIPLF